MKLGIWLPIVHRTPPYVAERWELEGGPEDIAHITAAADACGIDYLFAPEHIALPASKRETRGEVYWDPLSTLGFVAAHTTRTRLVTLLFVASYHHPLEVAKRMATLDRLSNGRAIIGVGVGSLAEEFELLGADFRQRGRRTDDFLRALQAARGDRMPRYQGPFYKFSEMIVDPTLRNDIPLWVGGLSPVSLKRAIALGDAWAPTRMPVDQLTSVLADAETQTLLARRDRPLDVVYVWSGAALDPLNDPQGVAVLMRHLAKSGVTVFAPDMVHTTREIYVRQIEAVSKLAAAL